MKNNVLIVNLIGEPCVGKSTASAYVFSLLKMNGVNAELITEFAKDKIWEHNDKALNNQAYIFGNQYYRITRCQNDVDVLITDSPILLSVLYNHDDILGEDFNKVVMNVYNSYNNLTFFINRVNPYNTNGRNETEEDSNSLKFVLLDILKKNNIDYIEINGDIIGYSEIAKIVYQKLIELNIIK